MNTTHNNGFDVRGYLLTHTLRYIRESADTKGLIETVPGEILDLEGRLKLADWCPGERYVQLVRLIADHARGDEVLAQKMLIESGVYVARTATNTFLRLLMKMLTPAIFAKKLPEFWKRDCTLGYFEVDFAPPTITCRLMAMDGFDHAACTGAGFVRHALEGMGKKIDGVVLHDWSLAKPYVNGCSFELTWSN